MLLREFFDRQDDLSENLVFVLGIGRDRELGVRDFLADVFEQYLHHIDGRIL